MTKNITLSIDEELIKKARKKAEKEHTSLNQLFRTWVSSYIHADKIGSDYDALMKKLSAVKGKKVSREEMNER
jgi:hypothetical protein